MSTRNTPAALQEIDRAALVIVAALAVIGWLMIYAANYKPDQSWAVFDLGREAGKQFFFIGACSLLFFLIQIIDRQLWRVFAWAIYGLGILLLVAVLFLGKKINGATAWFQLGGFSFQPSELVKFGTCLALSSFLSGSTGGMRDLRSRLTAFGIVLLPMVLILLQPDAGSALVFLSFLMLFYREGLSSNLYAVGGLLGALIVVGLIFPPLAVVAVLTMATNFWLISKLKENRERWFWVWGVLAVLTVAWQPFWGYYDAQKGTNFWDDLQLGLWFYPPHALMLGWLFDQNFRKKNAQIQRTVGSALVLLVIGSGAVFGANLAYSFLKKHQQERIDVWLRPEKCDPRGALYNVLHSKMAIGSGGLSGKGFLDGNMTKLRYVPEQSTDFIFCTVGEEQGFLGALGVIGLFFVLLWRVLVIAERQRSDFARRYAWCVAGILFVHVTINIGMTMGLFPIIGIPLPFISYGGSSLIGFTLMMAVLLKFDSHRFSG